MKNGSKMNEESGSDKYVVTKLLIMKETPISVLCKQIRFYQSFIVKLKTKDGIDKDSPQDKLDNLIRECEEKIKEFNGAMKILDPTAKCEQIIINDRHILNEDAIENSAAIIILANKIFGK